MAGRTRNKDPLREAFLDTARNLDGDTPGLRSDGLARAVLLAMMRRSYLDAWRQSGLLGKTASAGFAEAVALGCPLLDGDLDGPGVDPRRAVELAVLPEEPREAGELYQRMLEFQLTRRGKDKALSASVRRADRRRNGAFFTPAWMAERLVRMALGPLAADDPGRHLHLLDPACGNGRLLLACVDQWLATARGGPARRAELVRGWIRHSLRGVDIDPLACALTRTGLWLLADPRAGSVLGLAEAIRVGDAIAGPLGEGRRAKGDIHWARAFPEQCAGSEARGFDVVVANPPFEVLSGFKNRGGLKAYVARIRASGYSLSTSGSLNTYRLFFERALSLLADGGRLAFVMPFGFLMDRTAAPLRAHVLEAGWLEQVEVYPESSQAFDQVGQSIVLLALKKRPHPGRAVIIRDGGSREEHPVALEQLVRLDPVSMALPVGSPSAIALAARLRAVNEASLGDLADGRVGEVDQTNYKAFMCSEKSGALLIRGNHLSAYHASLDTADPHQRWLEPKGFGEARGGGRWRADLQSPRVVQTGIVNMEAARRLVAAEVPQGVYLGNSVNYWVPVARDDLDAADLRGYLLGLLNSTPLEWRFRLTSSNNNVNLYEIRPLPLPRLGAVYPAERIEPFIERNLAAMAAPRVTPLGLVRQITGGWGAPGREDRAVAILIGRTARLRARTADADRAAWLDHAIDHLINWHLGLDEPDLDRMLKDVPARAFEEKR